MLPVEPILERMFLTSGAGVELGRAVLRVAAVALEPGRGTLAVAVEPGRGARGTSGFFSAAAAAVVLLETGVLVARGRAPAMLLAVVEALRGAGLERAASETTDISLS